MGLLSTSKNIWRNLTMRHQPSNGGRGGWGSLLYSLFGTKIDFAREVGDARTSSLAMAAIRWTARNLYDARLRVVTYGSDRKEKEIEGHDLTRLFARPNKYYSGRTLASGIAFSYITQSIAYILKVRSAAGRVVELWYEPNWSIRPVWDMEGKDFISYYEICRQGVWRRVEVEDVIAICDGYDPDTRRGLLNPWTSLLRPLYIDNQMAQFTALLLRNGLVPPVVISVGDKDRPFDGDINAVKAEINRKMSGDSAGEALVTNDAVMVNKLGFDYSSIGAREVSEVSEARFCAAMGISPFSLNLMVAQKASTYNNVRSYLAQDYRAFIVPLQKLIAEEFNIQLLPDFGGNENESVSWDYSNTEIMRPDQKVEAEVATLLYEKGLLKRSEGRERVGYKWDKEDDKYANEIGVSLGSKLLGEFETGMPEEDELEPKEPSIN